MTMIYTHRGSNSDELENTLSAFNSAYENHTIGIAIDLQLTKDKEIVLFGDAYLERLTKQVGKISDYTLLQLKRMDVVNPYTNETHMMLTIGDYLEWAKDKNIYTIMNVMSSDDDSDLLERTIIRYIHNYQVTDQVILASYESSSLSKLLRLDGKIKLGYFFDESSLENIGLPINASNLNVLFDFLSRENIQYVMPTHEFINHRLISLADVYGLKIISLPAQNEKDIKDVHSLPIEGIITDHLNKISNSTL